MVKAVNRKGIKDWYFKAMKRSGINFELALGGSVILFYSEDDKDLGMSLIEKLDKSLMYRNNDKIKRLLFNEESISGVCLLNIVRNIDENSSKLVKRLHKTLFETSKPNKLKLTDRYLLKKTDSGRVLVQSVSTGKVTVV